ncbi:MAG: hypothetical protein J0H32_08140 [Rhizobiales bacterium]|nr:hypothetical protein [Hyphomicrobiales bacterium]
MAPRWTADEIDYPTGGTAAVHAALPHRPKPRFALADLLRAHRECDGNAERAAKLLGCCDRSVRIADEREPP